eukprot:4573543-Amphidinium_carterae.2
MGFRSRRVAEAARRINHGPMWMLEGIDHGSARSIGSGSPMDNRTLPSTACCLLSGHEGDPVSACARSICCAGV